ncbi:MAG: hypothetical protein AAGB46_04460 [Verrucomicrobiota bacterium]
MTKKTKTWTLLLPDWSERDTLWRNSKPFALWPVGNQLLIDHWLDHAVENGFDLIEIHTADRPTELRDHLNGGAFWSREIRVVPISSDDKAPEDATPVLGLPNQNRLKEKISNEAGLLRHWLYLNRKWVESIDTYRLRIEVQHASGGWIGPHARIHPGAKLVAPFWIQGKCDIAPGAQIGPNACIGENAIIDEDATIQNSVVLPGTMVGRHTMLDNVAVDGGLLLDGKHGCRVPIADSFILSKIGQKIKGAPLYERIFAALLFSALSPVAALSRIDWTELSVHDGRGGELTLKTGNSGRLIFRRIHWLKEVFKGRMRLIGILPRPTDWSLEADNEVEHRLKETLPGFLSLSDLHDCHSPNDPDEWIHASYQALGANQDVSKIVRSNLLKLAFKNA